MSKKQVFGPGRIDDFKAMLIKHYEWIFVILSPLILFGPMLISGKTLFWGTPIMQFVPWREFAIDSLLHGHFPLWNPWLGMGAPLIANYQSAIFYPPNWILPLTGSAWGQGLLVLLHVIWTGIGILLLARQLGLSKLSQAVAALSFSLSGYVIARAGFLSINATVAWLPWIILAADRVVFKQKLLGSKKDLIKPILLLSLFLCFQWLAGHAQTAWYCLILTVVWVVWRCFSLRCGIGIMHGLIALSAAMFLAFMLSAVQLLPTAEYLIHSHRATEVERELALAYSFWPWRILSLLMPNLFGNPATGDYWGYANYWEDAIYIGILPLILAFFACVRGIRGSKYSSLIRLLIVFSIISIFLALGKNTPFFIFLYENVPTFDLFQAPTRWNILMVFSLSLLAAIGTEFWQHQELLSLFWVRLGTVGAAAASIIGLLGGQVLSDLKESLAPAIAFAGLWLMLSGVIAWRRRIKPAKVWPLIIVAFISIDLLWATTGLNPTISVDLFRGKSQLAQQVSSDHRIYMPADVEETLKFEWTHRFDTFYPKAEWQLVRDFGLPNTTMLDGIPSANNFDPILPARYVNWMAAVETAPTGKFTQMMEMMNVGWVAAIESMEEFQIHYLPIRNPNPIYLVGEAIWVEGSERVLTAVLSSDFRHEEQVILEGVPTNEGITDPLGSTFEILDTSNKNRIQVKVNASDDCWFVLSDTWFPGWEARVDGERVDLYRANYIFQALRLPNGEHMVELSYRPLSFIVGGAFSLFSWLSLGAFLWILGKK
jgi:hypothetical protein